MFCGYYYNWEEVTEIVVPDVGVLLGTDGRQNWYQDRSNHPLLPDNISLKHSQDTFEIDFDIYHLD